jgi:peptidoglycan/LPS O-acetylase OafA/YrhL
LRFFAAFGILVLHYRDLLGPLPELGLRLIIGGQFGVTFFFLLSGFILTYTYDRWFADGVTGGNFARFQRFRLARIYPIYLLALVVESSLQLASRQFTESPDVLWASWLINLLGLQSWTPGVPFTLVWNTPSWSISTEFFFYACFPFICAWFGRRNFSAKKLLALLIGLIVGSSCLFTAVIYLIYVSHPLRWDISYCLQHYFPLLRLPEFLVGCLIGRLYLQAQSPEGRGLTMVATPARRNMVLIFCALVVLLRILMPSYTGANQLLWLLDNAIKFSIFMVPFAGIILAVASGPTFLTRLLCLPVLILLGEASYALYITHWIGPVMLKAGYLGTYKTPLMSVAFMLGSIGISVLLYRFFETPLRLKLRGRATISSDQRRV